MSKNADQIVVAANGTISVAPSGTSAPTTLASLAGTFTDLGYATEDGATITKGREIEEITAWQSPVPVRRFVTGESLTVETELEQWNQASFETAFGGEWTGPTGSVYRYDPPAPEDALAEQVLVLDWADGDRDFRLVVPAVTIDEDVETQLTRTGAAVLPVTFKAVADEDGQSVWYLLSNDTAFAATGS